MVKPLGGCKGITFILQSINFKFTLEQKNMRKRGYLLLKASLVMVMLTAQVAKAQQWGNYTLYAPQNGTTATMIDTTGATYHTWSFATQTAYATYLIQGGTLLRSVKKSGVSFSGGPISGEFQKLDWNGNILWDYSYSSTLHCSHHDILAMPNGNVMMIAYDRKTAAEVTAAGCTYNSEMWPESLVEVQQTGPTTGTIVWEWHLWDHLVQSVNASAANYQSSIVNHPELYNINFNLAKDFMHMNGIDFDPIRNQICFSSHMLNEMYVIDHSTTTAEAASHSGGHSGKGGDFLYRYGNPSAYQASGSTVLNVVHDAHFIPEGVPNAGYLVGFVNNGVSMTQSSVDQVSTPKNGYNYNHTAGLAYTPSNYTLRHACNGHTSNQGNAQQLPNGNTLVCMAFLGSIYEVNSAGTTIWTVTPGGTLVHAYRFDDCYINHAAPALPTITASSTDLTSSTGTTYQWFLNGEQIAGATSQTYTPSVSGIYLVRITDVNGCAYYYSNDVTFTMGSTIGIAENEKNKNISLYPNPTTGILYMDNELLNGGNFEVNVYDVYGKLVMKEKNPSSIDLNGYDNGIYFVSIVSEKLGSVNRKINLIK